VAFSTAACATLASATLAAFVFFSCERRVVASFCCPLIWATSSLSSVISVVSFSKRAFWDSSSAASSSTSEDLISRVCLFVASSVSHYACWSASELASSMSFTIKSLIIDLILAKGSDPALFATKAKYLLPSFCARLCRNSTTRCLT
jgi:hypothetical protein